MNERSDIQPQTVAHKLHTALSSMYLEAQIPNTVTALSVIGPCFIVMILIGFLSTG